MDPRASDANLLQRFRDGDEEAFRQLFAQHLAELERRLARRVPTSLRRRFDVSDVVQETRLAAFEGRERFEDRGPEAFCRWIKGIGDNKLGQAIRRHGTAARRAVHREVTRGRRPDTQAMPAAGASPSQVAASREAEVLAREALAQLAPDHQEVIRLTQEGGLSLEEVAKQMRRSRDATRMLLRRAVERFAEVHDRLERGPGA